MKGPTGILRRAAIAALTGLALAATSAAAAAQARPGDGGPAYQFDLVTGYPCVTNNCDVVRLPDANCICKKENPGETNLGELRLTCSTREGGQWVACPVAPRYGN